MRGLLNRVLAGVLVFSLGVTAVWHLSPYVQGETTRITNLIASNISVSGMRLLAVGVVDSSGNHISSFGESGTVAAINEVNTTLEAFAPDCDTTVAISEAASGNQQLVAAVAGQIIQVCGGVVIAEGTVGVQFISDTGTDCSGGSESDLTGVMSLKVDGTQPPGFTIQPFYMNTPADALCIELSASVQVSGYLTYTQYTQ